MTILDKLNAAIDSLPDTLEKGTPKGFYVSSDLFEYMIAHSDHLIATSIDPYSYLGYTIIKDPNMPPGTFRRFYD